MSFLNSDQQSDQFLEIEKKMISSSESIIINKDQSDHSKKCLDYDTQTEQFQLLKKQVQQQIQPIYISQQDIKINYLTQFQNQIKKITTIQPQLNQSKLRYINTCQKKSSKSKLSQNYIMSQKFSTLNKEQIENRLLISQKNNRHELFYKLKQQKKIDNWIIIKQIMTNSYSSDTKLIMEINILQKECKRLIDFFMNQARIKVQINQWLFFTQEQIEQYIVTKIKNFPQNIKNIININSTIKELKQFFMKYEIISLAIDKKILMTNKLHIKKYKNCIYYGQMYQNIKEGYGVLVYYNGKIFQGKFNNDKKEGQGVQINPDQSFYICEYKNGMKNGLGIHYTNQSLYFGMFKNNFKSNIGFFVNQKIKYLGQWQKNQPCGFCMQNQIITDNQQNYSNQIFIGNKIKNKIKGFAIQKFQNGDLYVGNYDLKPQGYGQYYWINGAVYRGNFNKGLRNGKAEWIKSSGQRYYGQYKKDKKCGYGIYKWQNNVQYKGQFQNDLRHGKGQMIFPNGCSYQSTWVNGIQKNIQLNIKPRKKKIN